MACVLASLFFIFPQKRAGGQMLSGSMSSFLRILPHRRCQQHQHRIQLEAACQHIEHEDILGDRLHKSEVAGRADLGEAGSDVVECTGY